MAFPPRNKKAVELAQRKNRRYRILLAGEQGGGGGAAPTLESNMHERWVFTYQTGAAGLGGNNLWDSWTRTGTNATSRGSDGYITSYAANIPRYEYDENLDLLGLLMEPAKTEYVGTSQTVLSAANGYTANLCTYTANDHTGNPESAATTCDTFADLNDGTADAVYINKTASFPSTSNVTLSCFVKLVDAGTSGTCYVALQLASMTSVSATAFFNLSTGAKGSSVGAQLKEYEIIPYNDGWYRIFLTSSTSTDTSAAIRLNITDADLNQSTYTTDGKKIATWGWQIEETISQHAFGPTSFAIGNRSEDFPGLASITGWYTDQGTGISFYAQSCNYHMTEEGTSPYVAMYDSFSDWYGLDKATSTLQAQIATTTGTDATDNSTSPIDPAFLLEERRAVASFANNDVFACSQQDTVGSITPVTSATYPITNIPISIRLNVRSGGLTYDTGSGRILQELIIYNTNLTETEAVDLCTNGATNGAPNRTAPA